MTDLTRIHNKTDPQQTRNRKEFTQSDQKHL